MITIPDNYLCSDECMTGVLQLKPTISDNVYIDERVIDPPSNLIEVTARDNAIHIIRPDGSTLDERHIPEPKATK